MPGLIALIDKNTDRFNSNRATIAKMTTRSCFEDFYSVKLFESAPYGLQASVISFKETPLTQVFCQEPFLVLFSGEIFLTGKIKSLAVKHGITMELPEFSAKFISVLYRVAGLSALYSLSGSFTILLIDHLSKSIMLINDRHGMKKWYFCDIPNGARLFSPDIISFSDHPDIILTNNNKSIAEKFRYDCILDNKTFFNEIKRVPIATCFKYTDSNWSINEYWTPEDHEIKKQTSLPEFIQTASNTFAEITPTYVTNNQTGLSLTGGWDTRCIASVLDNQKISLPAYTFSGCLHESYDVKIARKIAGILNWPYQIIELGKDFLNNIDYWMQKASIVSDGLSNLNTCHEYFLNLQARKIAPVRLTGKYGSQLIRGVTMLKDRSPDIRIFSKDFRLFYSNTKPYTKTTSRSSLLRFELPLLECIKQNQEEAALNVRTPYMDNAMVDIMLKAPDYTDTALLQKMIIRNCNQTLAGLVTNRGEFAINSQRIHGVGTFYKTVNFIDMVYNWESLPQWVKIGFIPFDISGVSHLFVGRKEWIHYRKWIQREIKEYVCSILTDNTTLNREIYDKNFIKKIMRDHFSFSGENYTKEIIKIIGFEIWQRHVERISSSQPIHQHLPVKT